MSLEVTEEQMNRCESYRILTGPPEAPRLRTHRALRRELCYSRTAIVFLLVVVCAVFCTWLYFQQVPGCKNEEQDIRPNASTPEVQAAVGSKPVDVPSHRPFAFLRLGKLSGSGHKNITWIKNKRPERFLLGKDNTSLIVPETGYYQISLQITYHIKEFPNTEILWHHLKKYSRGYVESRVLLSAFETVPKQNNWFRSVHSTDVFLLQKDDELRVETSNIEYVYQAEKTPGAATFLTAHLIEAETER